MRFALLLVLFFSAGARSLAAQPVLEAAVFRSAAQPWPEPMHSTGEQGCKPPFRCESGWRPATTGDMVQSGTVPGATAAVGRNPVLVPLIGAAVGAGAMAGLIWYSCRETDCIVSPTVPVAIGAGVGFLLGLLVDAALQPADRAVATR